MWLRFPIRSRKSRRPVSSIQSSPRLRVEPLEDRTVPSTFTVGNLADSGAGSLRQAVLDANATPGADLIRFAAAARDGTVVLTGGELEITDDLHIDGPGADRLTVSGNDASRVFRVLGGADASSAITVGISNLTVAHGRAADGGGILNSGFSDLRLSRTVLSENVAIGRPGSDARGGGVFSDGSGSRLGVVDSSVVGNTADGRVYATRGGGGGLSVQGGHLSVVNSTVADNRAVSGSTVLSGAGGGIGLGNGATGVVAGSVIRDNWAVGGVGGGPAHGGGIRVGSSGLLIDHSVLTRNQAVGGNGDLGRGQAYGGAVDVALGSRASIADSALTDNRAIAGSGGVNAVNDLSTSTALGGAISSGVLSPGGSFLEVTRSLLGGNQAIGGNNGTHTAPTIADVGSAHGGAIYNARGSEAVVRESAILHNKAVGGDGNTGNAPVSFVGTATGGGIDNSIAALVVGGPSRPAKLMVIDSILLGNEAIGRNGNTGGGEHVFLGAGLGGGVANYLGGTTDVIGGLLTLNRATGGEGGLGAGGGIFNALGSFSTTGGILAPSLVNVTSGVLVLNRAQGGSGSDGLGGGVYNDATSNLRLRTSIIVGNFAVGGSSGRGIGGGVYNLGTTDVDVATLIVANEADEHDDCFGCP